MESKWCYVIVQILIVSVTLAKEFCSGGRSLRGFNELTSSYHSPKRSVSCCDGDVCHGGLELKDSFVSSPVGNYSEIQQRYASALNDDVQRHKRSIDQCKGCRRNTMEVRCCPANMSIFFPISALSAVTGERVHVIQAPPLVLQPVVFGRCETDQSLILDADCVQDYSLEILHVGRVNPNSSELELSREPVVVDRGCTCRMNPKPLEIMDGPDIDETMSSFLDLWSD